MYDFQQDLDDSPLTAHKPATGEVPALHTILGELTFSIGLLLGGRRAQVEP